MRGNAIGASQPPPASPVPYQPVRVLTSVAFTAHALTATSTSSGPGSGTGQALSTFSVSGPPWPVSTTARIERGTTFGSFADAAGRMTAVHRAVAAVPLVLVPALGLTQGGFSPDAWVWSGALAAWACAVAVVVTADAGALRREWPWAVAAGALLLWTILSPLWSVHAAQSVLDARRTLVYAAVVLALLLLARRDAQRFLVPATHIAISSLLLYALARYLFGARHYDEFQGFLLHQPLGYANAIGILAALGLLLAHGLDARAGRRPRRRGTPDPGNPPTPRGAGCDRPCGCDRGRGRRLQPARRRCRRATPLERCRRRGDRGLRGACRRDD